MEAFLINLLTSKVLVPAVPPLVGFLRTWVLKNIPPRWIPALLALAGSLVGIGESQMGLPETDLSMAATGAWEGALMGLAATGVHQLWQKFREWKNEEKIQ